VGDTRCVSYPVWASELKEGPFGLQTGKFQPTTRDAITASERSEDPRGVLRDDDHEMIDLYAYKTELGAVAEQVRALEVGKKLSIVVPFDL
jgi:hypothetical protein